MRVVHALTLDPHSRSFLIDGVEKPEIVLHEGHEYVFDVDCTGGVTRAGAWIRAEDSPSGVTVVANGRSSIPVPESATLRGLTEGGRSGRLNSPHGFPVMDISDATISELSSNRNPIRPMAGESNSVVEISVDGVPLVRGTDYSVDEFHDSPRIIFSTDSKPKAGSRIRMETGTPAFVEGNGTRVGRIVVRVPRSHTGPRSYSINTIDESLDVGTTIRIKREPGSQIAPHVRDNLPRGIADRSELLVKFLEDFFDDAGSEGAPAEFIAHLNKYRSVDTTLDEFLTRHDYERAIVVPNTAVVDRRLLLKRIADFYRVKGTDRSYSFLMRILFNRACEIRRPGDSVMRASDSKWIVTKTMRLLAASDSSDSDGVQSFFAMRGSEQHGRIPGIDEFARLEGSVITGMSSRAHASVETASIRVIGGKTYVEIEVSGVLGSFLADEIVSTTGAPGNRFDLHFYVVPMVVGVEGRVFGQNLRVLDGGSGFGMNAVVGTKTGGVVLLDGGAGYSSGDECVVVDASGTELARLEMTIGTVATSRGRWEGVTSIASGHSRIQDGWFHQIFSYLVSSEVEASKYVTHFRNAVHPTGWQMFQEVHDGAVVASANANHDVTTGIHEIGRTRRHIANDVVSAENVMVFVESELLELDEFRLEHRIPECAVSDHFSIAVAGVTRTSGWTKVSVGHDVSNVAVLSFGARVSMVEDDWFELSESESDVHYMAVRCGDWVMRDGRRIEAGRSESHVGSTRINFGTGFSTDPVVVVSFNSVQNHERTARVVDVDRMGFTLAVDADSPEDISWVASEESSTRKWTATSGSFVDHESRGSRLVVLGDVVHSDDRSASFSPGGTIVVEAGTIERLISDEASCGRPTTVVDIDSMPSIERVTTIRTDTVPTPTPHGAIKFHVTDCPISAHGRSPYIVSEYSGTVDDLSSEKLIWWEHPTFIRSPSLTHEVGEDECATSRPTWTSEPFYRANTEECLTNQGVSWNIVRALSVQMEQHRRRWRGSVLRVLRFDNTPDARRTTEFGFVLRPELWPFDLAAGVVGRVVTPDGIWCAISFLTGDLAADWRLEEDACLLRTHYWYSVFHDDAENWYHWGAWHDWTWPRNVDVDNFDDMQPTAYEIDGIGNIHRGSLHVDPRVGVFGYDSSTHPTTGQNIKPRANVEMELYPNEHWIVGVSNVHDGGIEIPTENLTSYAGATVRGMPPIGQIITQRAHLPADVVAAMREDGVQFDGDDE